MLPKWKLILSNWINCYFNNSTKKDLPVNLESLLDIISHLRENLNLDESKSSLLDAHTVQEFVVEKYPDFKFENGTVEPDSEEDVNLIASLLLFFVCVNSKNVDMKSAMCSKLSPADQEIILKFSKHLMECPKITITDVQAAITEVCGQDSAAPESIGLRVSVAETPPALRSYHSEVRRLQAALDTERFDRTYLQEELNRTNMKVEKLLKDKEQYKLEIVNLKAQISLCCGEDRESQGKDVKNNNISKLTKQLEEMEERVLSAQEQLEVAQMEGETYKIKLNQLKLEHERLIAINHQESVRATNLAEELEVERRQTQSLRELVAELRQHNILNRMNSSLLECDDPDTSINSLQHNSSVCSESCAKVIEVQLVEERAKIVALKQQIQMLQDQLCEITRKTEEEKESFLGIISKNESTIMSLKHRVNEEIEEKNTLKAIFDNEVAKLNNEINELEQRLKGTQENSRHIIENKMKEIKNLQEEKLSLLQSLTDETTKSENIIKCLKDDIDAEKSSRIRLRDEYESHIMKLNEKVLNRNNELVELQNKILEKGETIESLQLELRREKESKEELSNKYNNDLTHLNSLREQVERDFQQKSEEARDLHKHLQQHIAFIEQINKDNDQLRETILQLQDNCELLKDSKEKLLVELKNRDVKAEQIYKETENLKNLLCEEKQKLQCNLEETSALINGLQSQLQNEVQELSRVKADLLMKSEQIEKLTDENVELNKLIVKYKNDNVMLEENNHEWKMKQDATEVKFNNEILKLKEELMNKSEDYNKLESLVQENKTTIKTLTQERNDLQSERNELMMKLKETELKLEVEHEEHSKIKYENQRLNELLEVQKSEISVIEQKNNELKIKLDTCEVEFADEILKLKKELTNKSEDYDKLHSLLQENQAALKAQNDRVVEISKRNIDLEFEKNEVVTRLEEIKKKVEVDNEEQCKMKREIQRLLELLEAQKCDIITLEQNNDEWKIKVDTSEVEYANEVLKLKKELENKSKDHNKLESLLRDNQAALDALNDRVVNLSKQNKDLELERNELITQLGEANKNVELGNETQMKYKRENQELLELLEAQKSEIINLEQKNNEWKIKIDTSQAELSDEVLKLKRQLTNKSDDYCKLESLLQENQATLAALNDAIADISTRNNDLEFEKNELITKLEGIKKKMDVDNEEQSKIKSENQRLLEKLEAQKSDIVSLEQMNNEWKIKLDTSEVEYADEVLKLKKELANKSEDYIKLESLLQDNQVVLRALNERVADLSKQNNDLEFEKNELITQLEEINRKVEVGDAELCEMRREKQRLLELLEAQKSDIINLEQKDNEWKIKLDKSEVESANEALKLKKELSNKSREYDSLESLLQDNDTTVKALNVQIADLNEQNSVLEFDKNELNTRIDDLTKELEQNAEIQIEENLKVKHENQNLIELMETQKSEIIKLESLLMYEKQQNNLLLQENDDEKVNLTNRCSLLEEYKSKAQQELEDKQKDIKLLTVSLQELTEKYDRLDQLRQEKDALINKLSKELIVERENWVKDLESKADAVNKLTDKLEEVTKSETDTVKLLRKENEELQKSLASREAENVILEQNNNEWKIKLNSSEVEFADKIFKLENDLTNKSEDYKNLELLLQENEQREKALNDRVANLSIVIKDVELEKSELIARLETLEQELEVKNEEQSKIKLENQHLLKLVEFQKTEIIKLESLLAYEKEQRNLLQNENSNEIFNLTDKCNILKEYQSQAQQELDSRQKEIETLTEQIKDLTGKSEKSLMDRDKLVGQLSQEKDTLINKHNMELVEERENWLKESELQADVVNRLTEKLEEVTRGQTDTVKLLRKEIEVLKKSLTLKESYIFNLEQKNNEWKIKQDSTTNELTDEVLKLQKELTNKSEDYNKLESLLQENQATVKALNHRIAELSKLNNDLEFEKNELITRMEETITKLEQNVQDEKEENCKMWDENQKLLELLESKKSEIMKLESLLVCEKQQNNLLRHDSNKEKLTHANKYILSQEYQSKAQQDLESKQKDIESLTVTIKQLTEEAATSLREKDIQMDQLRRETDALVSGLSKELAEERVKRTKETESKTDAVNKLMKKLEEVTRSETDTVKLLRKENELLKKSLALRESFAAASHESCKSASQGVDGRDQHQQVDNTPTEHTQSSFESYKTISDLERILQDRNRTIRSLQSDIKDLKSLVAESENKLLDVSNDLEVSKENCHQLSSQLKKIVHQKNEEIADLKKQLTKMSVTENRASQIIKVSAKYQAMILKRIAEIKSNTVLKELTNFGNTTTCDNELRRGLNAGTITMEDLENFLDTTDRHLKRFSEKQVALQKERDRLVEVNKINESEIINMRKFLTELSVSIKTFNSVKELYTQKLSRVVSLQRTVRREILDLEGQVTDAMMCKLERGYAAIMQDLSECAMNLERWVERTLGRVISPEKIKQAFLTEERLSVATTTIQNASLEVQLEELENSFCKLLEEIARAQKGDGAKDAQAVTVMEVRAEYEDKLNRMKAKMKQLYQEQIGIFKDKQKEEINSLELELKKAREKLEESSRAYEDHIRGLTMELWNVGEKFLMKKNEAEWLRRKQRSGSLMSLQHVHSAGLVPTQEEPSRPSDTHSLRSLPVTSNTNNKGEGRTLHMSDEEGEVFDNRCLRELATTPARAGSRRASRPSDAPPAHRLSELQWRNSLCPPHLKSSYPAETQFVSAIHEEDIKCVGGPSMSLGGRSQRKEVGITAYKKPGPPTPSKQAGRLSATDSELRESLRVETEPNASRKTGTPSRIRALFRSAKGDNEGTPRSRRLSNIFRKK